MFIQEAANYVNLTVPQFRKYIGEGKIKHKKYGMENYYDYDNDDIEKLKCYLNIVSQYKNNNFNICINDNVYEIYKDEIDKEYIKNIISIKKEFSLEEYKKYKFILDKKRGLKIKYNCNSCNQENYIDILKIKNLDIKYLICNKCQSNKKRKEISHKKELEKNLKKKQNKQNNIGTKNNPILWENYNVNDYCNGSKKWVKIICSECHEDGIIQIRKFENRKYGKGLPICSNCIMKYVTNHNEWKKVNSEAQLIAQNRPKTIIKRNRKIQQICNSKKMKHIRRVNALKLWKDKNYAKKIRTSSNKYLKGYYNDIWFDSSWELSFIVYFEKYIKRCDFGIEYIYDNKKHTYYPDFILEFPNNNVLAEIKGIKDDLVEIKKEFAINFVKNSDFLDHYKIFYLEDLKNLPDFIIYNNVKSLSLLNKSKLKIISYPRGLQKLLNG